MINDEIEGFIRMNHAQLHTGTLFQRRLGQPQLHHFSCQGPVTIRKLRVFTLLGADLIVKIPDLRQGTFARPNTNLQKRESLEKG